jgi:protein gp37
MSDKTKIEWADATWNPVTGCTPVSPGCEHCYAKRLADRFPQVHGERVIDVGDVNTRLPFNQIEFHPDRLEIPLHWREPRRIFVCSMGDLFHPDVRPEWIYRVLDVIAVCPQHTFMVLTKRPENILDKLPDDYGTTCGGVLPNLWLGVTAENQEMADKRMPILLQVPAAKRFVSVEPMLGPVWLSQNWQDYLVGWETQAGIDKNGDPEPYQSQTEKLDWVICGPETSPGARHMNLDWARSLRDQCVAADVPFFYKRGELDGKLWHQFPVSK